MELGADNISAGQRPIQSGDAYNHYFTSPKNEDTIILRDGEVLDTLDILQKVVIKSLSQTTKIAKFLRQKDTYTTCMSIWSFLHDHIQYKLDAIGVEQLREPSRSWAERKTGIDCDCFSVFVSSILSNLGISHKFRITKYYGKKQFQHIYVVVPSTTGEIIIDCVLSKYDYEKPYSEKKDIIMNISKGLNGIDIAVLSGIDAVPSFQEDYINVLSGAHFSGSLNEDAAIIEHLQATRRIILARPGLIRGYDDPGALVKMLDYAIMNWNTPNRDRALSILASNEEVLNGIIEDDGLGKSAKRMVRQQARVAKKETRKETKAAKKEVRKETKAAKKEVKKLQKTLKKVATTRVAQKAVKKELKAAKKDIRKAGIVAKKQLTTVKKNNIQAVRSAVKKNPTVLKIIPSTNKPTSAVIKTLLKNRIAPIVRSKQNKIAIVKKEAVQKNAALLNTISPIVAKQKALVLAAEDKVQQNLLKMGIEPEELDQTILYEETEDVYAPQQEQSEVNDVLEEDDYEFLNQEEPEELEEEFEQMEEEYAEEPAEFDQESEEEEEYEEEYEEEEYDQDQEGVGRLSKSERKKKRADKKTAKKEVKAQNKTDRKNERARIKSLPKKERTKARIKNIGKALLKVNPITAPARGAFLMALKLNIGKMAVKVKWGYATESQAKAKGISKREWEIQKLNLADMERIFEKMGGTKSNLKVPILHGKAGNLSGIVEYTEDELRDDLEGLGYIGFGDPITLATVTAGVAAAVPMIVSVIKSFKKNKSMTPQEEAQAMAEIRGSSEILTDATNSAYAQNNGFDFKKIIIPAVIVGGVALWATTTNKNKKRK